MPKMHACLSIQRIPLAGPFSLKSSISGLNSIRQPVEIRTLNRENVLLRVRLTARPPDSPPIRAVVLVLVVPFCRRRSRRRHTEQESAASLHAAG